MSGLPFDAQVKTVEDFFSVTNKCGVVSSVRLIKFEDTGRCNGQAYVTFNSDEGAKRAIKLSGTTLGSFSEKKKKNNTGNPEAARKELKLKVSKVLNRKKTKRD